MPAITNGKVVYVRRLRTGDFEHREATVELAFTISEEEDPGLALSGVAELARHRAEAMVVAKDAPAAPRPAKPPGTVAPEKMVSANIAKAAEKPVPTVNAASMVDVEGVPSIEKMVPTKAETVVEDAAPEITDARMLEHVTHANTGGKNIVAIRNLITEFVGPPPAKLRDLPQDRRQEFINRLPKP